MMITSPDTLAGIRAHADAGEAKLIFDDTEAAFGTLEGLGISPMAAPERMVQAWQSGYITFTGTEGDMLRVTYLCGYAEDTFCVDTWFQSGVPVHAELSRDGQMTVQIDVTDFTLRKAETIDEDSQKNVG